MLTSKHKNTDLKRVHKDFKSLVDGLDQTFDGQVILADDAFNFEELTLSFTLRPNEGIYKDCEVEFLAELTDYPDVVPNVRIMTDILHPNINAGTFRVGYGDVCLNILDEWESDFEDSYKVWRYLYKNEVTENLANMSLAEQSEELKNETVHLESVENTPCTVTENKTTPISDKYIFSTSEQLSLLIPCSS
ncbi:hypothetical protein EB796_017752 [Bugula neritina]|uniref:UBC core domain-containing protein n=1 Tax=Bugula neritina TaxID=10212 RepID=A0A7J7JCM4_BUGNE|nr:hypothetical protein EB796_017752 [Bugula neritina]